MSILAERSAVLKEIDPYWFINIIFGYVVHFKNSVKMLEVLEL